MLPQFLVQNDLISNPSKTDFNLDWFLATPIVNLNFFHIEKLLDEQEHYRQLLRPWTLKEEGINIPNYGTLKTHEYGYATEPIPLSPLKIYAGTLVGRIHISTPTHATDFIAATQTLTKYYIEYENGGWIWKRNSNPAFPAIIRGNYANLETPQRLNLNGKDNSFILTDGEWSITCGQDDSKWRMSLGWEDTDQLHPILIRSTDIVFGRVLLEKECIANIPITLQVQWNFNLAKFMYTFSFKDQNFPSNATVELY